MKIDEAIVALETPLRNDLESFAKNETNNRFQYFSHRHAVELHALGIQSELTNPASDYGILQLQVVVSEMHYEHIQGQVIWFRFSKEFGMTDHKIEVKGFSKRSIKKFTKQWSSLMDSLEMAIARSKPKDLKQRSA